MKKKRRKEGQKEAAESQSASVEEHDSEAKSFGPWLRRQREGRGIELRDIAQASKISVRYLDALENNQFEALPAELFTKGFLRQYSSFVGLDAEEVVNYYLAAKAAADDEKAEGLPDELRLDSRQSQGGTSYVVLILLVTAALVALIWWYSQRGGGEEDAPGASPPQTEQSATSADAPKADESTPGGSGSSGAGSAASLTESPQASAPSPGAAESESDASPGSPETEGEEIEAAPGGEAPRIATVGASGAPIELVLDFKDDCWVEASIDGQPRIAEMHVQGESLRLGGTTSIELMVGNIDAVGMELNGRAWQPPGTSKPVRRMSIDLATARGRDAASTSASGAENSEGAP